MKILKDLSPNFTKKTRKKKDVKFVIIHYTGMQSEIESLRRLKSHTSKVSCHYLINRKGQVTQLVKDENIAWHAGKSKWKKFTNLNKSSIGIELENKGHQFGYQKFSEDQIKNLIILCKHIKKKYKIKTDNFLGHSDIAPLRKIDPGEKFPWKKLSKFKLGKWYLKKKITIKVNKKKIEKVFFKNIQRIGYRYFKTQERSKRDKNIVKSFQQHYLPKKVTGRVDQETFIISHFLTK